MDTAAEDTTKPPEPAKLKKAVKPKPKKEAKAKKRKVVKAKPKKKAKRLAQSKVRRVAVHKLNGDARTERLDMRLTKAQKAKIYAKSKKTRRTVTSLVIEAIEKIR